MKKIAQMAAPLIVTVVLIIITANFGIGRVSTLRSKIAVGKKNQTILTQKLSLLNEVGESGDDSSIALIALPSKNPSLTTMSQIKLLSATNGLFIANIKSGPSSEENQGISRVDISFDVEGPRGNVMTFISEIEKIAPISSVQKIKLNDIGSLSRANVTVRSYFSPLPEKLPALTDAIKDLTSDERNTLNEILNLTQPIFSDIPPSENAGRVDPFNP